MWCNFEQGKDHTINKKLHQYDALQHPDCFSPQSDCRYKHQFSSYSLFSTVGPFG